MASGSFQQDYVSGHYSLLVEWSSTPNTSTNTSAVTVRTYLVNDWAISMNSGHEWTAVIDGTTTSGTASAITTTGKHLLGTATKTVTHSADGTRSITIRATFEVNATLQSTYVGTMSTSKTVALDTIPRAATVTQSLSSRTETTIKINWSASAACDRVSYSTDGGSTWSAYSSVNASSGSYTISGLTPSKTYSIKTKVRRKDNSIESTSSTLSVTTSAFTVTQSLSSRTETTIKMNWSSSSAADRVYYSTNGGSTWSDAITVNASSGTYTISGLAQDHAYNIKTRVRMKGGGAESTTSSLSVSTLALPTITQSVQSKTETTITMKWVSDSTCDRVYYSLDGTWSAATTVDGKSGTYTISGLSANSSHSIKTRIRRKSTGATNDSSALSVITYDWPHCTTAPSFVIGDSVTLKFYNPLGRSMTVSMRDEDDNLIGNTNTVTGTTLSGFNGAAYTSDLYNSIPNDLSATYQVWVAYSGNTEKKTGGTYSVNESISSPVIGSVSYEDRSIYTTPLTGDNQLIVQGRSAVHFDAAGLSARNGASLSAMYVTWTGKATASAMTISGTTATSTQNYTIGTASNVRATFTLVDSRGLKTVYSTSVTMIPYSAPSVSIRAFRENGYYSQSYLTANAAISPITVGGVDKNSIQSLTYALQKEGSNTWSGETSIANGVQTSFAADNTSAWTIRVTVTDALQTVKTTFVLPTGMPLIFFDRKRTSVGINCFPQHDNAFETVPIADTYNPAVSWGTSGGSGSPTLTNKTFYYAVTGNVMQISGVFQITAMGNSGSASLRIDLPAGYTCATGSSSNSAPVGVLNPVTPASRPLIACARGSDYLYVVGGASAGTASPYMSTGYYMLSAMLIVNVT